MKTLTISIKNKVADFSTKSTYMSLRRLSAEQLGVAILCFVFFIAYSILSLIRFWHLGAYGFDLGINDQVVWEYSHFKAPTTTIDAIPFISKLNVHLEFIYLFISPFYLLWSSPQMLLLLQSFFVCVSGIPIYFICKRHNLHPLLCFVLASAYLSFYGVQNALWFDVHSVSFASSFIAWFLYFLDGDIILPTLVTLILAITSKENIAGITLLISIVYLFTERKGLALVVFFISLLYLFFAFFVFFPHFVTGGYRFQNTHGLLSDANPAYFFDTREKLQTIFYSVAWFGFLPLLSPLYIVPALGDLASYFILGKQLTAAQGLYMQYRITLAPLLVWSTVETISVLKKLNNKYCGLYLFICVCLSQYALHLPLSYLTKSWFWTEPASVSTISHILSAVPNNASIVAQNNIIPFISERDAIYTLWPEQKKFATNSPCGKAVCDWFHWTGNPIYLIVDTSPEWDSRHFLTDRNNFLSGLANMGKAGVIIEYKKNGTTVLYKIIQ